MADNGPASPRNTDKKNFHLFQRLEKQVDGIGIGLAIVKRVAEVHGGRACVAVRGVVVRSESMSDSTAARHFLLVEDEPSHADLVRMALEDNGVAGDIAHVTDGAQAMAYLSRRGAYADAPRPDLILLDLHLPKLSGHEVLRQIKQDDSLRDIPVIVLSTSASDADRGQAYERHANSFATKPFELDQFQRMMHDLCAYWTVWNQPSGGAA